MITSKKPFSVELEKWLKSDGPKTLDGLTAVFGEKSFAIAVVLLMFLPALPLPTGGITHVFEAITLILSLEMLIGRRSVWLPQSWRNTPLGGKSLHKFIPFIARRIRWFEKYSRPRLTQLVNSRYFLSVTGVTIFSFTLAAMVAPPFTGLDTLPALGAVSVALSLILEDMALYIGGVVVGVFGIFVEVGLAVGISRFITSLFQ